MLAWCRGCRVSSAVERYRFPVRHLGARRLRKVDSLNGRTDGRVDGRTDGRVDGWTDGQTIGRMDGRMNELTE